MRKIAFILIVLLLGQNSGFAQKEGHNFSSPFLPDHITGQFAGNIGFLSVGFGYESFLGRLSSDLIVGYVPLFIGDATIITIAQKNTFKGRNFRFHKMKSFYPTVGFSVNIETGNNSFLQLPSRYPEGYYGTNAIKVGLFTGLSYKGKVNATSAFKQITYYAEVGTLASYIYYNFMQEDYFNTDIFSLALGLKIKI